MRTFLFVMLSAMFFIACNETTPTINTTDFEAFGATIDAENAIEAADFFTAFTEEDSIPLKIHGNINEVCKKKGCWMTMTVGEEDELLVRFKDYGFFVPLNADGHEVIIDGWAYKEEIDVATLKHYAFDAGKTQEEIDLISEPEVSYSFMADGVLIK